MWVYFLQQIPWPFEFSVSRKAKVGQGNSEGGAIPTFLTLWCIAAELLELPRPRNCPALVIAPPCMELECAVGIRKILCQEIHCTVDFTCV
jgi:hypothetical protein